MTKISETDLILNADGSVYHLHLLPEHIADNIIVVGDPERTPLISKYFDSIEFKIQKREFVTHTGYIGNKRFTVISSGMGTDNVEILINELYALSNINLENREINKIHKPLNIIRLGTSGSIQKNIAVDSILLSTGALGIDGLNDFYKFEQDQFANAISRTLQATLNINTLPYFANASNDLLSKFGKMSNYNGITITCPGFYAPQGRSISYNVKNTNLLEAISNFEFEDKKILNMEMETAGWYAFGKLLGFNCLSINAILANRTLNQFSQNTEKQIDRMITEALNVLTEK